MTTKPVALIVGGGSGIGADSARKLAESGYDVAVMSSSGKGEALGQELGGLGFTGSNLEPDDLKAFVAAASERFGRIDGVVNCAGHGPKGDLIEISDEDWHLGMDVYLLNVIRTARLVLPSMQAQGKGSIVNVSTFAVFEPDPDFPTSAVFRAGLASYTKLFSTKYAAEGIRMNNVLPGFIDSLPEKAERTARIPAGRYAKVRELSEVIAFLVSDASSYVTGQNLRVDGGLTASV
jgi:NAD(P)-dependent dehydrogenase (short-subunit alcohol dehydrogenase family)